ncbi:NADP-dependent malic enzyme [Candidatus Saccharibacteria bacterium]|nr:MAG: NADP-dependent malic enzyme [Candidatus Saccharibacteria bacterium]
MDINDLALELHKQYKGKITTALRDTSELDRQKLSAYYSPGVAAPCLAIQNDPSLLPVYTWTNNLVAVISNGTAVLGLGDIGPKASMPVMEGKALLFKHFAGIDSIPIILDTKDPDEIVRTVKTIAGSFGAINLEDIAAPICFEVEERLKAGLDIPVFHDDQHGTAVVTLAGLINACKVTGRKFEDLKIGIVGAGAAGVAIAKLIHRYSKRVSPPDAPGPRMFAVDSKGVISHDRTDLNESKKLLLEFTNASNTSGSLEDVIAGCNVFIGVSQAGLLTPELVATMEKDPIVFALANPVPEIMPDAAKAAGVAVIATGRSDFPNQVNNAIAFPGIFRGALDNHVQKITDEHKIAAAEVIASLVDNPTADEIIPSVFNENLVPAIANVIR